MAGKITLIRVDGNRNTGLGHIYRGIALAKMLNKDYTTEFLIHSSSLDSPIKEAGFHLTVLPESIELSKEPEWFAANYSNETIIILDGYNFKENYQKAIKQYGFKLVYIDDLAAWHMYADLVINHSPGIKPEDYSVEPYTKFALGTDYAILRPAFLKAAGQTRTIDKIDTAFVCFGGSDVYDLTLKVTKALLETEQINKINIVIGVAYEHKELFLLKKDNPEINIYQNIGEKELLNIILDSHLAIVSASTILYEVCAVKMPVLSGIYIENQKSIFNGGKDRHVLYSLDDLKKQTTPHIKRTVDKIIKLNNWSDQMKNQKKFIDQNVPKRISLLFSKL